MIYAIIPYGDPVLRQKAAPVKPGTDLKALIEDMFATMDVASGVGLAAPQIGKSLQLFVVDVSYFVEDGKVQPGKYRKVYVNPVIEIPHPTTIVYHEEGCLSIPGVIAAVPRSQSIRIKFFDQHWKPQEEELVDMSARVIQHEHDHLLGKLHIDYLPADKRLLLEPQLEAIKQGKIQVDYALQYNRNKNLP